MASETFSSWAVVELMGHRKLVGYCAEVPLAGGNMLRIDVPECNGRPAFTEFHGNQAIYGINPVDEEVARALLERSEPRPWFSYMLPAALPRPDEDMPIEAPPSLHDYDEDDLPF